MEAERSGHVVVQATVAPHGPPRVDRRFPGKTRDRRSVVRGSVAENDRSKPLSIADCARSKMHRCERIEI
jgi:hypothetical protein